MCTNLQREVYIYLPAERRNGRNIAEGKFSGLKTKAIKRQCAIPNGTNVFTSSVTIIVYM